MEIQIPQTIEVSANTAVKILYDFFNLPYRDGYYVKISESGVKGIYYTEDISTHGSSDIREFLHSEDKKKVEPFEHLVAIEKLIQEKNTEKVGHWKRYLIEHTDGIEEWYECSECKNDSEHPWDYCHHCGSKMMQEVEN